MGAPPQIGRRSDGDGMTAGRAQDVQSPDPPSAAVVAVAILGLVPGLVGVVHHLV